MLGTAIAVSTIMLTSTCAGDQFSVGDTSDGVSTPTEPPATSAIQHADTTVAAGMAPDTPPHVTFGSDRLDCVAQLDRSIRIGQVLMPGIYGPSPAHAIDPDWQVGGLILMTWPAGSDADDLASLLDTDGIALHLAVDEEGGSVQRLRSFGRLPPARDMAALPSEVIVDVITEHGRQISALGVTMVMAPVIDLAPTQGPDTMGNRTFGNGPLTVDRAARAVIKGWQRAGITAVVKHFPGHGSASADTHDQGAQTPPLEVLLERDLIPYRDLEPGVAVMVGHLDVPNLDSDLPASLSQRAIEGLLRDELGIDALVITDALDMGAITTRFTVADAAVLALAAGADIVLYTDPTATPSIIRAIETALINGTLAEQRLNEAVVRVLISKDLEPCDVIR